jgi:hypothetical protein
MQMWLKVMLGYLYIPVECMFKLVCTDILTLFLFADFFFVCFAFQSPRSDKQVCYTCNKNSPSFSLVRVYSICIHIHELPFLCLYFFFNFDPICSSYSQMLEVRYPY